MAKIHEEIIIIKVSKLIKESESDTGAIVSEDTVSALANVAEELVGPGIVVETDRA